MYKYKCTLQTTQICYYHKGGIQNQMEPDNIMEHQVEEVYFLDNISSIPLAYVV